MSRRIGAVGWVACWIALLAGCGEQNQASSGAGNAAGLPMQPAGPPLTKDECQKWGKSLEAAMIAGDRDTLSQLINFGELLDRSLTGLDCSAETLREMKRGALSSIEKPDGFLGQMIALTQHGGNFGLLHVEEKDGQHQALFRVLHDSGALNYHSFQLFRNQAGKPQAGDIYVFLSGELISDTMRQLFRQAIGGQGLFDKLTGKAAERNRAWKVATEFQEKKREGKAEEALALFAKLPADMKHTKGMLLLRLQAAQQVNDTEYLKAIEEFRANYPRDAALDLLLIDKYVEEKNYAKAEECIDHLDEGVGGDPYLEFMRARWTPTRPNGAGQEAAERGIKALPNLQSGYWVQINIGLKEKDFERVGRLLNEVSSRFNIELEDLSKLPDYADFVAWPGYQDWLRKRQGKDTTAPGGPSDPKSKAAPDKKPSE